MTASAGVRHLRITASRMERPPCASSPDHHTQRQGSCKAHLHVQPSSCAPHARGVMQARMPAAVLRAVTAAAVTARDCSGWLQQRVMDPHDLRLCGLFRRLSMAGFGVPTCESYRASAPGRRRISQRAIAAPAAAAGSAEYPSGRRVFSASPPFPSERKGPIAGLREWAVLPPCRCPRSIECLDNARVPR